MVRSIDSVAMRDVAVWILHPEPGAGAGPLERWVAAERSADRGAPPRRLSARRRCDGSDRLRAARRYIVRSAAPRAGRGSATPAERGRSCWAPARSRWRRSAIGGRSLRPPPRRRPHGARQQPLLGRRRRDRLRRDRSSRCPTCPPTTRSRAGWRRSPGTRSTTCGADGGSRSTSTGRSTSLLMGRAGRFAGRRRRNGSGTPRRRGVGRRRSAGRAGRGRAHVGRDPALAGDSCPCTRPRACRGARHACSQRPCTGRRPVRPGRGPASVLGLLLDRDGPGVARGPSRTAGRRRASSIAGCCSRTGSAPTRRDWPPAEDRFASDLLLPERVADPWLRDLTASAAGARIPVLLGGHTLVGPWACALAAWRTRPMDLSAGLRREPPLDLEAVGEDEVLGGPDPRRDRSNRPDDVRAVHGARAVRPGWRLLPRRRSRDPGRSGDFLTAPEAHPIFGQAVASQLVEVWERLGRPAPFVVREHGAGDRDPRRGHPAPARAGAAGAACRRSATCPSRSTRGASKRSASGWPRRASRTASRRRTTIARSTGVVLANEVLDALPVHRVRRSGMARWPNASSDVGADGRLVDA